jgi:hypothetical protein
VRHSRDAKHCHNYKKHGQSKIFHVGDVTYCSRIAQEKRIDTQSDNCENQEDDEIAKTCGHFCPLHYFPKKYATARPKMLIPK